MPSTASVALCSMREVVDRDLGIRRRHSTRLLLRAARSRRRSILGGRGIDCDAEISNHGGKVDGESDLALETWDENMLWVVKSGVCGVQLTDCHGLGFLSKGDDAHSLSPWNLKVGTHDSPCCIQHPWDNRISLVQVLKSAMQRTQRSPGGRFLQQLMLACLLACLLVFWDFETKQFRKKRPLRDLRVSKFTDLLPLRSLLRDGVFSKKSPSSRRLDQTTTSNSSQSPAEAHLGIHHPDPFTIPPQSLVLAGAWLSTRSS